jgi:hypothetical protein
MFSPKAYIKELLVSRLEQHVADFDRSSLDIGLWNGEIALKNLTLKQNYWQITPDINYILEYGQIDKLHIEIPWTI